MTDGPAPSRRRAVTVGIAAVLALAACAPRTRELRVLQTTDLHGRYSARLDGEEGERAARGGLRRLASHVERHRRAVPEGVLLLDAGDMWSGTMLSDRNEGALGVEAYNRLGYDAVALGNHEFDYGPVGPRRAGGEQPFGALRARLAEADFPVLAANVVRRDDGAPPDWPNLHGGVLVDRGGFEVGLVGITPPDTPEVTFPYVGEHLAFTDPVEAAEAKARELRERGAEVVLVLAHLGARCTPSEGENRPDCDADSPLFRLARGLPDGLVDGLLGGHSDARIARRVAGTAVVQAGERGRHVARLDVRATDDGSRRIRPRRPVPLDGRATGSLARRLDELLAPAEARVRRRAGEELGGRLVRPLTRRDDASSPLGSFVCDVLLARRPRRDVCLVNSGGLRADLPAGPITYGALYDALPFGNRPAILRVDGGTLRELVRIGTSGAHGVLQTAGLRIVYDRSREPCPEQDRDGDGDVDGADRDRLVRLRRSDGTPIEPDRTYRVVTNGFLARGGDGWAPVVERLPDERVRVLTRGLPLREAIAAWLRRHRPVLNPPDHPVMPETRVEARGTRPTAPCPER